MCPRAVQMLKSERCARGQKVCQKKVREIGMIYKRAVRGKREVVSGLKG
jgi:hypothetical protein